MCMRSWTPAKSSHSPQRSRPTSGWSSGHGSVLVAGDLGGSAGDDSLALGELPDELLLVDDGTRDAGDHRRGIRRPAPGRREPGGEHEARPRRRDVADRLGDVPVRLAARQRERIVGERLDEAHDRGQQRRRAGQRSSSRSRARPAAGPRGGRSGTARPRCRATRRRCRAPPSREQSPSRPSVEILAVAVRHLRRVGPPPEAPHRDDPDGRPEGEQPEGDPPRVAIRSDRAGRSRGS